MGRKLSPEKRAPETENSLIVLFPANQCARNLLDLRRQSSLVPGYAVWCRFFDRLEVSVGSNDVSLGTGPGCRICWS